jgi:hypothetical protein
MRTAKTVKLKYTTSGSWFLGQRPAVEDEDGKDRMLRQFRSPHTGAQDRMLLTLVN